MKFIDWLRKLGILRFGSESAVYHNAKERPLSLQQSDIFNSKKDVLFSDQPDDSDAAPQPSQHEATKQE